MTVAPVLRPQSEANASDKCAEMSFEARHQPPNTVLYLTKNPSSGPAFSMIVGPVVAEDVRIVEQYITSDSHQTSARLDAVSDDPAKPVLYRFLPRRREGLPGPSAPGKTQREVLEQILGPFARPLVAVFFDRIHPSFPVVDEVAFWNRYEAGGADISNALMCQVYASALIYWNHSAALRQHPCPDIRFAWNQSVSAMEEDFLSVGDQTIPAVLLSLVGRPIGTIMGNTIGIGKTVALAHAMGLNRDPSRWNISEGEKMARQRLWWGILIQDRWSSLAHGVPTYIHRDQYDVPIPDRNELLTVGRESNERLKAADSFILLCRLTEILGQALPLAYNLRDHPNGGALRKLRHVETYLDEWEESLPAWMTRVDDGDAAGFSGPQSLHLGFLTVKMLLCRISLRESSRDLEVADAGGGRQSHVGKLFDAALAILKAFSLLSSGDFEQFWLPYDAFHLASATTVVLRCIIEQNGGALLSRGRADLLNFVQKLRRATTEYNWDLADVCLSQCEEPILQVAGSDRGDETSRMDISIGSSGGPSDGPFGYDGTDNFYLDCGWPADLADYPWDDLWDMAK